MAPTIHSGTCVCGRTWYYTGELAGVPACTCGRTPGTGDVQRRQRRHAAGARRRRALEAQDTNTNTKNS